MESKTENDKKVSTDRGYMLGDELISVNTMRKTHELLNNPTVAT